MPQVWSEGVWFDESDFSLAADDRAVLHGMSAFETMLAIDGVLQHADRHFSRLQDAIAILGLGELGAYEWSQIVREICEKNDCAVGPARLRLTVTAGEGSLSESRPGKRATHWLTASALVADAEPCRVIVLPWTRNERGALAGLKAGSYGENLLGLRWARQQGASEGIFFNNRDELCEACTANVFVKMAGVWHTPALSSGCLPGVMRAVILDAAREQGIVMHESNISRAQFDQATEMFLTSALRGIKPVFSCGERDFNLMDSDAINGIIPLHSQQSKL